MWRPLLPVTVRLAIQAEGNRQGDELWQGRSRCSFSTTTRVRVRVRFARARRTGRDPAGGGDAAVGRLYVVSPPRGRVKEHTELDVLALDAHDPAAPTGMLDLTLRALAQSRFSKEGKERSDRAETGRNSYACRSCCEQGQQLSHHDRNYAPAKHNEKKASRGGTRTRVLGHTLHEEPQRFHSQQQGAD